ncbi:MAG: hypothetical protein A2W52_01550 [Candidatus Taylorbacteria bacterium RIFCSPHIGHO2_02_49_25]|uniref:DUF5615 domain-containing protein n=1 Tax=Candidatus Taylorbacteria bacterium RIFCSPHIGHO2_02_49_25 TaxID=1802305 RepID=A0A1G2MDE9_9BACT|nr:MAG: hypothetical protein A2W52_01550 [Candidatus Taylorbacteria bacterium RIFCSPHIGHO2_02_49_25]OHA35719.1 MAG: hypothetical protein A2W65_02260 [Candidatus Taylorbacteria bacterium RIFCSPLOWO2_02_50_13]
MRFLLDANIALSVKQKLRIAGFEAFHVADVKLGTASDGEILAFAKRHRYIVITHDKDFGNVIRIPIASRRGVILLRLRDQRPDNVIRHLLLFLAKHVKTDSTLVILSEHRYRIYRPSQ